MKWRIALALAAVTPALLEALRDGRVTRDEAAQVLAELLLALGVKPQE